MQVESSQVDSDDAFLSAATDGLKKLKEGCAVARRVPICGEEFAAVTGFLCGTSRVKLEQCGFDAVQVHVVQGPAGVEIAGFGFAGHEAAVQVNGAASGIAQVFNGLLEARKQGLMAGVPTESRLDF